MGKQPDYAAELKAVRKRRLELSEENREQERKLQDEKEKAVTELQGERLRKALDGERRRLEQEEKRSRELEERAKREGPQMPEPGAPAAEKEAKTVELCRRHAAKADADPFHAFVIVRRFFGVGEFRAAERRKGGVVSETKKLVGFR